ncbi:MAG: energy-coupling factor transporter transmembrane component T [Actinomycetaceae bacterium]|nr:energy-coupling factor transporter transmembrane component T [Actinomycetaceae bacterium]
MAERTAILGYIPRKSFMHSLTGTTKLIMMVTASIAAMLGFDTRFLVLMVFVSVFLWVSSRIELAKLKVVLWLILILMILNNIMIFVFAPQYGTEIYGTTTQLWQITPRYTVTAEQLFYQLNVTLKYFAVLPIALLFIVTTSPSEFASSLNRVGIPYKVSYSVSLALRYIPDVQREYREISQAQQARGVDTSRDVSFSTRVKNSASILLPLLLSSLEHIETISTAMELRGFGKANRRTWYTIRPLRTRDWVAIVASIALLGLAAALIWVNGGRFYNPFI